ncbi:MAG: hypothetical protein AB7O56_04680 [Bauldia sp.]
MAPNPPPLPRKSGIGFVGVALTLLGIVLVAGVIYMIIAWEPGVAPRSAINPNGPEPAAPVEPAP